MGLHLFKDIDHLHICPYCRHTIKEEHPESRFHDDFHYKSIRCPKCDSHSWVKVDFLGSGHDDWAFKSRRLHECKSTEERVALRKINGWI